MSKTEEKITELAYLQMANERIASLNAEIKAANLRIIRVESAIQSILDLPEMAITTAGFQGWAVVPAEGYESQTFLDADEVNKILTCLGSR